MPHFNKESLIGCFKELSGRKAVGIDGMTKDEYGQKAGENIEKLVERMKGLRYRPQPVREVLIPKDGQKGKYRPLGISIFEDKLVQLLRLKIKDERLIRYVIRMLKAGILSNGELRKTDEGSPQGSVCSPVLANVFAHYAIDMWFKKIVKTHTRGEVELFRYCDDNVICCQYAEDAEKIIKALKGRLDRFSLKLNEEKTKMASGVKTHALLKTGHFIEFLS